MTTKRQSIKTLIGVVIAVMLVAMVGPALVSAEVLSPAPWWSMTAGSRPTNLQRQEVQEVTVRATGGEFLLIDVEASAAKAVAWNASAANVQVTLEEMYGAGNVEVAGGPGDEGGTKPYVITFIGALAGRPVEFRVFSEALTLAGGPGKVSSTEKMHGGGEMIATAENRGDANTSGLVTITDKLPVGLEAVKIEGIAGENGTNNRGEVTCTLGTLTCTFSGALHPFEEIEVRITVAVKASASSGELNTATAFGGGAAHPSTASHAISVGGSDEFGFEDFQFVPENVGGTVDTQAGSHPFQVTNVVTLNSKAPDGTGLPQAVALPKSISGELPAGFLGNPTPFAQCTDAQFATQAPENPTGNITNECPAQAAIGVATVSFTNPHSLYNTVPAPIFNMKPLPGEPARFGFKALGIISAFLDAKVRTGGDYGVTTTASNITQLGSVLSVKLTFWGVPGDPRHDSQRGWECLVGFGSCSSSASNNQPPPFLVLPTSCEAPFLSTLRGESWSAAGHPTETAKAVTYRPPEALDGCNHLPFSPSIKVTPDGTAASSPTGLNVDVHVPQGAVLNAESLAESTIRGINVALPEGVAINPAGSDGLQACAEGQVGYESPPVSEPPVSLHFTPTLPVAFCPSASKIGTVRITTPILPHAIEGAVYIATQNENPFGSLVALYIVAEDPVSGTLIKLAGETHLTETGQIVTTINNSPQAPFEDAELHFFGGERAPLATPARCGTYTTSALYTPWSGNAAVSSQSHFDITAGPHGGPCPGASLPFSPSLSGGTTNIQAGALSSLTTTMSREDGNQDLQAVQLHMPAGLSGLLSSVKLCGEEQANAGTCGPESEIGETTVSAGVGSDPVSVKGGKVFITGPYRGAPFGLSIVDPVKAGPFDLEKDSANPNNHPACDCVVVRASIQVDLHTAALTITTDPTGTYAIPHIIDSIPVQIKAVNVTINRPGFTFNPTNCNPSAITGSITSDEGATRAIAVPFQVTNCAILGFKPVFNIAATGKTSKAKGAGLTVKLSYPKAPFGSQANIARVKVDLPKQLPSRLTTLQKACLAATFEANPANCPAASIVGHAKVITPLLPVPLLGPAYFVSHGGEAFPSLTIVLQGYGVTEQLIGATFIKKGITSSTFNATPDVPFSSFELTLPQGKYSALAAFGNLCKSKLAMPTEFVGQNGVQIHQSTKVQVTGCPKHKVVKHKRSKRSSKPKHK